MGRRQCVQELDPARSQPDGSGASLSESPARHRWSAVQKGTQAIRVRTHRRRATAHRGLHGSRLAAAGDLGETHEPTGTEGIWPSEQQLRRRRRSPRSEPSGSNGKPTTRVAWWTGLARAASSSPISRPRPKPFPFACPRRCWPISRSWPISATSRTSPCSRSICLNASPARPLGTRGLTSRCSRRAELDDGRLAAERQPFGRQTPRPACSSQPAGETAACRRLGV